VDVDLTRGPTASGRWLFYALLAFPADSYDSDGRSDYRHTAASARVTIRAMSFFLLLFLDNPGWATTVGGFFRCHS